MVYDLFPFFNELDLLEIRLNTLKDVVDRFVIAESTVTFTGKPKDLVFRQNRARFAPFLDRITYLVVDKFPEIPQGFDSRQAAWLRENFQRNELVRGLRDARPDDTILLSDLDEIPDPAAVRQAIGSTGVVRFGMRFYNFFLNFRNAFTPNWPIGTQACRYATFLDERTYDGFGYSEFVLEAVNRGASLTKLRMVESDRTLKDAGWHFSYCGGVEAVISKLQAFSHTELNTRKTNSPEEIKAALDRGRDVLGRGYRFFGERIDATFPAYVVERQERFAALIFPVDEAYLRKTRWARQIVFLQGAAYRLAVRLVPKFLEPLAVRMRDAVRRRRVR